MFLRSALLLAFVFAGCDARRGSVESPAGLVTYEARGVVKEVRPELRKVVIAHEAIPGYMGAMTMEFEAAEAGELDGLQPGDAITFRLAITDTRGWIERVRKTGRAPVPATTLAAPALAEVGAPLPDCALTDQRGRRLRLREFHGRALALTFIYTRCPFPDFCPRMSDQFRAVQQALLAAGAREDWSLLSITIDPQHDTPERLAAFAERYEASPAHWTFLTGDPVEIEKLGQFFGVAIVRNGAEWNHNLRTVVVDPAGRVQKVFAGNEWKPEELVAELRRAMSPAP